MCLYSILYNLNLQCVSKIALVTCLHIRLLHILFTKLLLIYKEFIHNIKRFCASKFIFYVKLLANLFSIYKWFVLNDSHLNKTHNKFMLREI